MDIKEVLSRPEYQFIQTNPHLGGSMLFATFGGSHAYGTNKVGYMKTSMRKSAQCSPMLKCVTIMDMLMVLRKSRFQKAIWFYMEEQTMCDFCKRFDFGSASTETDKYGARIILAGGSYHFPEERMFSYCPVCGQFRTDIILERERTKNNDN